MKASKLIRTLNKLMREEGNLVVIIEVGEMSNAEFVEGVDVVNVDIDRFNLVRLPWNKDVPTNAKAFLINEYSE